MFPSLGYRLKRGKKFASTRPTVSPRSPLFPLGICRRNSSPGERQIHLGYLGTTQHSWTSINLIFEYSNPFPIASQIHVCDTEYMELLARTSLYLCMKINQFCLLLEVYTKQTKLSDGLDRMPWRKGAAESEKQTEEKGKSLPVGDK